MKGKTFELNENTLSIIEEIGGHMPGGFFIYRADDPEELIYANKAVLDIYGCASLEEFRALTGYTFRGMVYPEDYDRISSSIVHQISSSEDQMDYAEYRIVRRDGAVRWVDDYGHYAETRAYGGIYVVFISDITDKKIQLEMDTATRDAVISTLTTAYNTVYLIDDVVTEEMSLYHTDLDEIHDEAIRNALSHLRYSDTKTEYVNTMVAEEDRDRMQEQMSLPYILKRFETRDRFSVNFIRALDAGPRHYRIDFGKIHMPGGRIGVMMGFKDVDDEVRQGRAYQKALEDAKKAKAENRRLNEEVQSAAKLADQMGSASSLLTNMPAMSFSKEVATGKYLACNQAFAEYAGKTKPEEVVGLTDHEIFDKATADHFVEDDRKAVAMDKAYVFLEDVPDASGTVFHNLQTTKITFREPSGRLCLLGMCVDVTEMTRIKTAEAEANADGVSVDFMSPDVKDDAKQIECINNAVAGGYDALIVAANSQDAVSGALNEAVQSGMKLIYVDSPANVEAEATFSTDNKAAGYTAGEQMLKALEEKGITEGSIGIVNINTSTNSTLMREEGFREALDGKGFDILETQYCEGDAAKAQTIAENYLTEGVVGIFGANEGAATGTGNAIKASGNDQVVGVGFDKSDTLRGLIADGYLYCTMAQNPDVMGKLGVQAAIRVLNGESLGGEVTDTGVSVLTAENVG